MFNTEAPLPQSDKITRDSLLRNKRLKFKKTRVEFEADEKYKDPFPPIKGMAISAGLTGAAVGGLGSAFYLRNKWPQILKHTAVGGALGALAGGGGAYIGTKILGEPSKSESTAYAKRTALGGALGGAAVGAGAAALLKHGKFHVPGLGIPKEYLEKYSKGKAGYRPLKFIKEHSTAVSAGAAGLAGGVIGGFHGLDEGFQADFIRNESIRHQEREKRRKERMMSSKVKTIRFDLMDPNFLTPEEEAEATHRSKKAVGQDRYNKAIIDREAHRRNVDYGVSAGAGALLGHVVKPKGFKTGRAAIIGAGVGLASQYAIRAKTEDMRDKFGERTTWARRFNRAPWVAAGAAAGGITAYRQIQKHPAAKAFLKRHFSAKGKIIHFDIAENTAVGTGATAGMFAGIHHIGGRRLKSGEQVQKGQRVARRKNWFVYHEGIGVGDNKVASLYPPKNRLAGKGEIKIEHIGDFMGKHKVSVLDELPHHEAGAAALQDIKQHGVKRNYNILTRNCQQWADAQKFGKNRGFKRIAREVRYGGLGAAVGAATSYAGYQGYKALKGNKQMSARGPIILFKKKDEEEMGIVRKAAIVGGLGAAALGATMIPAFGSFGKIGARTAKRTYLQRQAGPNARKFLPKTKMPIEDPKAGGKFVADYLEGAHYALGKGLHGKAAGALLKHAQANPTGRLATKIGGPFQTSHFARFRSDHLDAISHWDWEYGLHHNVQTAKKIQNIAATATPATAEQAKTSIGFLRKSLAKKHEKMAKGREAFHTEVNYHRYNRGLSTNEAVLHTARTSENPEVHKYLDKLAASKAEAAKGYTKKSLLAPGLLVGGVGAAGLGVAGTAYASRPKVEYGNTKIG